MQVKSGATYIQKPDLVLVQNFAKDTGDFKSLSKVDQLVIALGVRLAKDRDDFDRVRTEPKPLSEFKPTSLQQDYERQDGDYDSEEEGSGSDESSDKAEDGDGWNAVSEDRQTKRTNKRNQEKAEHFKKKQT